MTYNAIGEGGLNAILTRRLDMKVASAAPAVAPEMFPGVTLENDRPEWGYLKGELRASTYIIMSPVVGQVCSAQFLVPAKSETLAVITRIQLVSGTVYLGRAVTLGGGIFPWTNAQTYPSDFRWQAKGTSLTAEVITNAAAPTTHGDLGILTTNVREWNTPIVIRPGSSLIITPRGANLGFDINVSWYERQPTPSELA